VDGEEILVREAVGDRSLVLFDSGDEIDVQAGERGIRFLLVSGKPIEQPVAWHGPIVMNTRAELEQAVNEVRNGTFIKSERERFWTADLVADPAHHTTFSRTAAGGACSSCARWCTGLRARVKL